MENNLQIAILYYVFAKSCLLTTRLKQSFEAKLSILQDFEEKRRMDRERERQAKERFRLTMLMQERIFKDQLIELHRLHRVQTKLMEELKQEIEQQLPVRQQDMAADSQSVARQGDHPVMQEGIGESSSSSANTLITIQLLETNVDIQNREIINFMETDQNREVINFMGTDRVPTVSNLTDVDNPSVDGGDGEQAALTNVDLSLSIGTTDGSEKSKSA